MTVTTGRWARSTVARWAGGLYLAYILANVLASSLGHIGLSDAQTLRATISGDEVMFRWGLVAALSSALLFVLTAWALYTLLRPVDEPLALLLLVLNAVGVAVQCASYLPLLAVLAQGDSAVDVRALPRPVLVWFLQVLLAPAHPAISYPAWAIGFIAELGLGLWLLVRGVRPEVQAPDGRVEAGRE